MIESRMEDIGQALIGWFSSRVSALGLESFDWQKQMPLNPVYPANVRAQCPRAYLRISRAGHVPGHTIGCVSAGIVMQCSIWLQMRQTPGENHQRLLIAALDVFQTALLQSEWRFDGLNVANLYDLKAQSSESVVYDELTHPLGDPALRVSIGELALTIEGRLRE